MVPIAIMIVQMTVLRGTTGSTSGGGSQRMIVVQVYSCTGSGSGSMKHGCTVIATTPHTCGNNRG